MIAVLGESLIDRIVDERGSAVERVGGAPFNVARGLHRLGAPARFVGRVSEDARGELIAQTLADDGAETGGLVRTDDPTMLAYAEVRDGVASYHFEIDGTAAIGLTTDAAAALVPEGLAGLYGGGIALGVEPIGAAIEQLVTGAGDDTLVMIDPNIRAGAIADPDGLRARHERLLARTDIVKVSTDDLSWMHPGAGVDEAVRALLALGAGCVVVTDGPRGARISTRTSEFAVPAVAATVIDTVGAGDAYCAGLLAWWASAGLGRDDLADASALEAAARHAALVAALSCERVGADPPTLADVEAALSRAA